MKTKRKLGVRRTLAWLAAVLAVLTLLGAFAALIPGPRESPVFTPFGSNVVLVKLGEESFLDRGTLTAASYANGIHFAAIDGDGNTATQLLASPDGKTWQNLLDHPSIAGQMPKDGIIDEVVFVNDTWFFGFFGWFSSTDAVVFRFRPASADNYGLGGDWQASFDGKSVGSGRATAMDVIDGVLYLVTEYGALYRKTTGGAWYPTNEADPTPFEGYRVFDLTKCGNKVLALGEDASGTVLFQASSMTGTWTMQRLDGIKANRFDTTPGGACFIAADGGKLAFSSNLSTWKISRMPDNVSFTEFFNFGGKHYAIGSDDTYGVLYESQDGASWERVAKVDTPLLAASVAEKEAILYGENGSIYRLTK